MNRWFAVVVCVAMASTMVVVPTMATTDSGAYGHHQLNCLGMLFGDPKVHEAQCGPFTAPPFWFPTGGSGPTCARVGEVLPSQILHGIPHQPDDADDVALISRCGCLGPIKYVMPSSPQLRDPITAWSWTVPSGRVLVAVC